MTRIDAHDAHGARVSDAARWSLKGENVTNVMNSLLCGNRIAGYALVQPTGRVLVAFGCLFEGLVNAPDAADDVITALLIDQTRAVLTLKGRKMRIVRREPDMLVAIEALNQEEGSRYPVACSAHSMIGNNVLLVAYDRGGHRLGVPCVVCALHDAA